jgi:hypothetical protein
LDYLINKRGIKTVEESKIDTTEAKKLYELVGRNIADLKSVADKILEQSFERLKKRCKILR